MKAKRIKAPDMKSAMQAAAEQVGEDAIIVSQTEVEGGFEVVVASESDYEQARTEALAQGQTLPEPMAFEPSLDLASPDQVEAVSPRVAKDLAREDGEEAIRSLALRVNQENAYTPSQSGTMHSQDAIKLDELNTQIRSLKHIIEAQVEPLNLVTHLDEGDWGRSEGAMAGVAERLVRLGLPKVIRGRVLNALPSSLTKDEDFAWTCALQALSDLLPEGVDLDIAKGGRFAFMGPTGVGKTTTIGKLASKMVMEEGPESIALVTMDTFKVASMEQLRTFGRILKVPVHVVGEDDSLDAVLERLKGVKTVLIDSAGMGGRDQNIRTQNEKLANTRESITKLLVVAASNQFELIDRAYDDHQFVGLDGLVLTKIDETANLGPAMSMSILHHLPVAYATNGQSVPNDLMTPNSKELVIQAIEIAEAEAERLLAKVKHTTQLLV